MIKQVGRFAGGSPLAKFKYGFIAFNIVYFFGVVLGGVYIVDEGSEAAVYRFGAYHETVGAGIHYDIPLLETHAEVDTQFIYQHSVSDYFLTLDEAIVSAEFTASVRITDAYTYVSSSIEPAEILESALMASARAVLADFSFDDAITERRNEVQAEVESLFEEFMAKDGGLGLVTVNVNYTASEPPTEVKAAYDSAVAARERAEQEIKIAETHQNGVIPKAKGTAQRMKDDAKAYKIETVSAARGDVERFNALLKEYEAQPEVTEHQLYQDAMDKFFEQNDVVVMSEDSSTNVNMIDVHKMLSKQSK